jgi:dipeptidase D
MHLFDTFEPKELWKYFGEILEIPRPSKKEDAIRSYLVQFAEARNLPWKTDSAGNVLISKPASKGMEDRSTVILQSHMDMVGEKNSGTNHNFDTDPIKPYIDGEWIKAEGTTLGADDGIGIAAQLAVLSSDTLVHGPLECLFTSDEESGLTGAMMLEEGFLSGKTLINLDSEDEGEFFIGCAGGKDTLARLDFRRKKTPEGYKAYEVSISGLTGGHSGDEIHKGQGHSIKILNRFLWETSREIDLRLAHFDGGNLRNAIPREAKATVCINGNNTELLKDRFFSYTDRTRNELKLREPNPVFGFREADLPDYVIGRKAQERLFNSIYACPHGVVEWSREIPELVETSTNLASVKFLQESDTVLITTSQRSSVESAKNDIASQVLAVFELAKAKVEHSKGYPGWAPNKESAILAVMSSTYRSIFAEEPKIKAIHAGLECGLFLEKFPWLDMISIGPTIKGAHSPDERLLIRSTVRFWKLLTTVLKRIP